MYFHWFPVIEIIQFLCTTFENFIFLENEPFNVEDKESLTEFSTKTNLKNFTDYKYYGYDIVTVELI